MNLRLKYLAPNAFELIGSFCITVVIVLLANSNRLLNYYGLHSSNEVIKTSAGGAINQALTVIDSISFTDTVVTFLIWAGVGVLCFATIEALGNAYQEFKLEQQVSSWRYIHPLTFTRIKFWRGVFLNTWTLAFSLALLGVVSVLFALFVVPLGLAYSRVFLLDISLANTLNIVLGLVVIYFGLVVLNIVVRCMLHRRRIFGLN